MKAMLDTNICIYIIKRRPQAVLDRFSAFPVGDIGISSITLSNWNTALPRAHSPGKTERPSKNSFHRSTLQLLTETRLKPMAASRLPLSRKASR